jgi:hypothetical protein
MDPPATHRGIAAEEPRNRGPIEYFRPKPVTRASLRARLAPFYAKKGPAALDADVEAAMQRIARGPILPDPPLSQPLEAAADPLYGLGTHPDIIEQLWALDEALPQRCRWLLWGGPALVHPETGVVFARGMGTVGFVMRLPERVLASADPDAAAVVVHGNPGQSFDIGAAGPEWRFVRSKAPNLAWARAAYDFAGEAADHRR